MKKKGFTLIEIMIVLMVFSIGVLAVLKLILHNINTMAELQTRTSATLLAKEGLELAYNTRDSNRIASLDRDCIINPNYDGLIDQNICKSHFLENKGLRTIENNIKEKMISRKEINNIQSGLLFINNTDQSINYTYEKTDNPSIFSRVIKFTIVKDLTSEISTGQLLKIESEVIYQKGSKTGSVLLEGFIGNY